MKTYIRILILIMTLFFSNSSLQAEWEKAEGYEFLKDKTFKGGFKRFVQDGKYLLSREKDTLYLYETETLNLEKSWVIANIEDADITDDLEYLIYGKYIYRDNKEFYPYFFVAHTLNLEIYNELSFQYPNSYIMLNMNN